MWYCCDCGLVFPAPDVCTSRNGKITYLCPSCGALAFPME